MSSSLDTLTPLERKYFKLYAQSVKKDYDIVATAMFLMEPDALGLTCAVQACRMAEELLLLQSRFVGSLALLAHKHKLRRRPQPQYPDDEEFTSLIASSFFKVMAVINSPLTGGSAQKDAGWFSGDSEDWQKNLAAVKSAWKVQLKSDYFSPILTAFAQLFHMAQNNKMPFSNKFFPVAGHSDEEWDGDDPDDMSAPEEFD